MVLAGRTGPRRPGRTHGGLTMSATPGTGGTVGIVANPVSGKDIRRLVANAPSSTLAEKYTIVRRDRKSTRLNSSHIPLSRMPSSA